MSFQQTCLLPPREEGDEIFLVFHPARSRLSHWQRPEHFGLERFTHELPPNVLGLRVTSASSSGELDVEAVSGPPELVKCVVRRASQVSAFAPPEQEAFEPIRADVPLAQQLIGPSGYLSELWTILDLAPQTPLWNYRRFFADLDRHTGETLRKEYLGTTNPALLALMEAVVPSTMSTLGDVMARRADDPTHGYRCPAYAGAVFVLAELRAVSDLFLSLLFKYFRAPGRGLDLDSVEDAFEMFANGELRLELPSKVWTTQPSSGLYFYFAEFALLCANTGIETGLWTRLSNALVRTQRIYCKVYEPPQPQAWDFFDYVTENYDPAQAFVRVEKNDLAHRFAGMSLDELCIAQAAHIEEFAPNSVSGPLPSVPPVGLATPPPAPEGPSRIPDLHPLLAP